MLPSKFIVYISRFPSLSELKTIFPSDEVGVGVGVGGTGVGVGVGGTGVGVGVGGAGVGVRVGTAVGVGTGVGVGGIGVGSGVGTAVGVGTGIGVAVGGTGVGKGINLKLAVTLMYSFTVTEQKPKPEQSPDQLMNTHPPAGDAVMVTDAPWA